jgi:hypothetical protein
VYQILPGTFVLGVVIGAQKAATTGAAGPQAAQVAQATLPFTGFAYGLYLALAFSLLVVGFLIRFAASRSRA